MKEIYEHGLSFTAVLAIMIFVNKWLRKKQYAKRDQRWESMLYAIVKAVGAEWTVDISGPSKKSLISVGGITYMCSWAGKYLARSAKRFTNSNIGRKQTVKDYLKKLGKTKFQSYLMVTIINIAILIAWVMGKQIVESDLNPYTPVISLIVQLIAGIVYQWVEGSIDKAGAAASGAALPPTDNSGADKSH